METVAIIDYGSGNLRSAAKAFERSARESGLDRDIRVTFDPEVVASADRVVLPGVGAFRDCRDGLAARDGLLDALYDAVQVRAQPFLGICVGMQLMATRGLEHGVTDGFGWIPGEVRAIEPADQTSTYGVRSTDLTLRRTGYACQRALRATPATTDPRSTGSASCMPPSTTPTSTASPG